MATMNVTLTEPMKDWVEAQTRTGHFSTASEYVRDLIQRDQDKARALAELEDLIDEGFESGISDRPIQDVFDSARPHSRIPRTT